MAPNSRNYCLRPVVGRQFAFDEAPAAYQHLMAAGCFGKVEIEFL